MKKIFAVILHRRKAKKMAEQRLIDANALKSIYEEWLSELSGNNPEHADEGSAIFSCVCQIDSQPIIDPESLPIVQQLRAEIKRLNGEITKCRDELNRANTALDSAAKWYLFHAE